MGKCSYLTKFSGHFRSALQVQYFIGFTPLSELMRPVMASCPRPVAFF